jgi:glycosyltransferase involved in cell wall biosynthesis
VETVTFSTLQREKPAANVPPSPERSILIVAQLTPPSTLVAARRVAGLTKYLARLGNSVTVLTSAISGEGPIEGASETIRTRDLMASPLNWRRRHFAALTGNGAQAYGRPSRLEAVFFPDIAVATWLPFALRRALALSRTQRFDCVITSSPPPSTHLIGRALERHGLCWIAELRDGWTFEPPRRPWPLAAQRRADSALEVAVLRRATAVVGVTAPIVEDTRERLNVDARLITNGFDPEEQSVLSIPEDFAGDRHTLVHTGRIALARSSPRPLLEALRILRRSAPTTASRLEVVFAGPLSADEQAQLSAPDLVGSVRILGSVDRARALALQRGADSLLIVTEGRSRRSVATGKLFEYLAAGRPILVLGADTEAARIVGEANAGFAAPADDPVRIAEALRRLVEDRTFDGAAPSAITQFSYPELARSYAGLINEVCSGLGR